MFNSVFLDRLPLDHDHQPNEGVLASVSVKIYSRNEALMTPSILLPTLTTELYITTRLIVKHWVKFLKVQKNAKLQCCGLGSGTLWSLCSSS